MHSQLPGYPQPAGPRSKRGPDTPVNNMNKIELTPCEILAKEKLLTYIHEYLMHIGATKSAEAIKNECFPANQPLTVGEHPGLLSTWFILFWELWQGDPEKREKGNPTQEAKAFHDFGFVQPTNFRPGFPMPPPPPMSAPPVDNMSPYFRPYGGANRAYGPPPGANPMMFPPGAGDVRNRMPRMPSNMNFPMARPRYGAPPYMDSPTGNPGFPQFMPLDQMQPPSTSVPTSMPMNERGQQTPLPPLSSSNPLTAGIINGEEIKHSPSHHIPSVHGQNGNGTPHGGPGSQHASMVGPGSATAGGAPTSVQSQSGQPGSVVNPAAPSSSSQQQPPPQGMNPGQFGEHGTLMDFQGTDIPNNNPNSHENLEIKKIREGLLDDYTSET